MELLLPNKIVAFAADIFNDGKWWPMKEHITAKSFEMKNSEMKKFYFVKINGILRRCPYFLIRV
jgi:hypothetical protein